MNIIGSENKPESSALEEVNINAGIKWINCKNNGGTFIHASSIDTS